MKGSTRITLLRLRASTPVAEPHFQRDAIDTAHPAWPSCTRMPSFIKQEGLKVMHELDKGSAKRPLVFHKSLGFQT